MTLLLNLVSFFLIAAFLVLPSLLYRLIRRRYPSGVWLHYSLASFAFALVFAIGLAWWFEVETHLSLANAHYDSDGLTEADRLQNVTAGDLPQVREWVRSQGGIGWLVKAGLAVFPFFFFYQLVFVGHLILTRIRAIKSTYR